MQNLPNYFEVWTDFSKFSTLFFGFKTKQRMDLLCLESSGHFLKQLPRHHWDIEICWGVPRAERLSQDFARWFTEKSMNGFGAQRGENKGDSGGVLMSEMSKL